MDEPKVNVSVVMVRELVTVSEDEALVQIAEKLAERGISGAPVVDRQGNLMGIISDGDILRFLNTYDPRTGTVCELDAKANYRVCKQKFGIYTLEPASAQDIFKNFEMAGRKTAKDVMTRELVTVDISDDIEKASSLMIQHDIKRLPVLENDKLVGIITRADIVRYVANRKRATAFVGRQ